MAVESTREQLPSKLLPEDAPDAVRELADRDFKAERDGTEPEKDVAPEAEHDAIFWLLQPPRAAFWETDVKYETPEGERTLVWRLRALKHAEIDEPERRFLRAADNDTDKLDEIGLAAEIVVAATERVADKESGNVIDLRSDAFRAGIPSASEALKARFDFQSGVLPALANEVRRISGWSPDRVGPARRVLVDVAKNS